MWFFDSLINKRVNQQVSRIVAQNTASLFNQNVFQYLNDGNIVINPDGFDYVEKGFESVGAVFECVDIIVKKIIACPRIVYRIKDQKEYKKYLNYAKSADTLPQMLISKAKALEEITNPQIDRLLNKPNPDQDGDTVYESIAAQYLLQGNAYLYGNAGSQSNITAKKWSELWAIPGQMNIVSGGFMQPVKEYKMQWYQQDKPFPAAQIKHFKTLNPRYNVNGEQLYGTSPLQAYLYSLDILKNADKQSDKQMKNGGKMGLLSPENKEDTWSDNQIQQMGASLKDAHASDDELSRTIPLSIAVKWTEIGLSSSELEILKTSDAKADDIYRAYHIPLQFRNQDSATYNNLPVANRQMVYNAVAPVCRRLSIGLTDFICPAYNTATETYIIEIDFTSLPELHDDVKSTVEWLMACDFLSQNEKREVIGWGRSAEPGMDEFFINKNKVRLQDIMAGKVNANTSDPTAGDTAGAGSQGNTGLPVT